MILAYFVAACSGHDQVDSGKARSLRPLMPYDQVAAAVGSPGRVLAPGEAISGGLVGKPGETVYVWKNRDGSNMTASFKDGRLTAFATYGL